MTPLSWIYMGTVWAAIIALCAFCFYRIFKKRDEDTGNSDREE